VRPLQSPGEARLVLEGEPGDERAQEAIRRRQSLSEEGIFREVHAPLPQLLLVGAGQVAMSLCTLGHALGFRVTVIDARPRFASRERFPQAAALSVGIASELVAQLPLLRSTSVVITAHDYKIEVPVLRAVLKSEAGYVGMLGNKRRGRAVLEMLELPSEQLARVHTPVGLDIGAQTAEEIALSVLGQIVAVRAGKAP
jgi:xanthine dehydrogenase accessory factor